MKTLTLITLGILFCSSIMAEEEEFDISRDIASSYETQSSSGEQVQCFPTVQVKKWATRKKKKVEPVVVEKVVERVVEKVVQEEYPRNSLSLLGGRSLTGLDGSTAVDPTKATLSVKTKSELDLGVMYQRRLGDRWRASGAATRNGGLYLGIGYDF